MPSTCSIICMSLDVWTRSPIAYANLRAILRLPSTKQLQRYKNFIKQGPGVVEKNLHWMFLEANKRKLSRNGRCGCIVFDEVQIQVSFAVTTTILIRISCLQDWLCFYYNLSIFVYLNLEPRCLLIEIQMKIEILKNSVNFLL